MRRTILCAMALVVTACGGGGGSAPAPQPPPPAPPGPSASEMLAQDLQGLTLDEFYDASFAALMYRSPERIVANALQGVYPLDAANLDDLSDAYVRETFAMFDVVLDALQTYDRGTLTPDQQLTYDFYQYYLQDESDRLQFIHHDFIATYNFRGVQSQTQRFFTDLHPLQTEQDALDYIARLNQVRRKFQNVADYLGRANAAGIVEPRLTLDVAISGLNSIADGDVFNNPYYQSFESGVTAIGGLDDATRQSLLESARSAVSGSVIPAYNELRQALTSLRASAPASIGVGQYPAGPEYYAYTLRHHTSTDLTAAEINQLGLDELQRIHAEMRVIFDQLGYPQTESLQQLFARVTTDGGVVPAMDVKTTYENIVAAAEVDVAVAFDIFPSAPVVIGDDPFGGFYIGPSFDGTRPGTFYAGTTVSQPWFQMPSLSYHEAVPGHHTQIAIAMDQSDSEAFRRLVRFTGFVEGWALYAERLAFELGWYDNDPYGDLGRLQYEALRAARLVMDTGIHDLGWTFNQAAQFNEDNVGWSRGASEGAAGRYSVVPGQATAYMVGMLMILDERQRAMDTLGADFDLTAFHRAILTSGGIPLTLLDDVVDRYIAEASN